MNVIAFLHAYKFTHFAEKKIERTKDPKDLSLSEKLTALFTGINNPRPGSDKVPQHPFKIVKIKGNKELECWLVPAATNARGTVIIFHGFSGDKTKMLDKAEEFYKLDYNTLLVDFMGSGGSEGNQTTIGFFESEQVKNCFNYLKQNGENNVYLFGTSMGAVAILKSIYDYNIAPSGIIIECPFGEMYKTTEARFRNMNVPAFPMAHLLVFWGGLQNGFWAYGHNPTKYAKAVKCPTLLLYGGLDDKVSRQEIDEIYANLNGEKKLKNYLKAGHENYLNKYKSDWVEDVKEFLGNKSPVIN